MTSRYTTIATWAGAIAIALKRQGLDSRAVFAKAGVDFELTKDPDARYLITDMTRLWNACVEATGNPAFGLTVPKFATATTFHGMGVALQASASLYDYLQRLNKLGRVASNVGNMKLYQRDDKQWQMDWHIEADVRRSLADAGMDAFLAFLAHRIGADALLEVFLVRSKPRDSSPWEKAFFNKPIHFGSLCDSVVLTNEAMQIDDFSGNPALVRAGEAVAMDYLQKIERHDIALQVESEIRWRLPDGEPKQQDVAEALNLSIRQLQRKLAAQNTSFAQLLQALRHRLSKEYLADSNRSIIDISLSLGFRDQSNFAAAFRRWEGVSPTEFRH